MEKIGSNPSNLLLCVCFYYLRSFMEFSNSIDTTTLLLFTHACTEQHTPMEMSPTMVCYEVYKYAIKLGEHELNTSMGAFTVRVLTCVVDIHIAITQYVCTWSFKYKSCLKGPHNTNTKQQRIVCGVGE